MLVLDTDHLSAFDRSNVAGANLRNRLRADTRVKCITIATVDEQMRGWMARVAAARTPEALIPPYALLKRRVEAFAAWRILPWDNSAVAEFVPLKSRKIRISTMDMRIACIVLANGATLLSRNIRDFERVPNLRVENWLD